MVQPFHNLRQLLRMRLRAFSSSLLSLGTKLSNLCRNRGLCSLKIFHGEAEEAQLLVRLSATHQRSAVAGLGDESSDWSDGDVSGGGGRVSLIVRAAAVKSLSMPRIFTTPGRAPARPRTRFAFTEVRSALILFVLFVAGDRLEQWIDSLELAAPLPGVAASRDSNELLQYTAFVRASRTQQKCVI